jgi:tetratricopeptide (TPR) repeat protein
LNAALSIDADSAEAHFRLGVLKLYWSELAGDEQLLSEAEQHFREAITIKSDFAMAYYNLARCLDKQQKPAEAIAAMRETLKLDSNYFPARRALGGLLMKAGKLAEAAAELERFLEIRPNDKQARQWLDMMQRHSDLP